MSGPGSRDSLPPQAADSLVEHARHFHLHGLLGRGGHGEVYRATMWREGGVRSEVAVKILSPELAPGSDPVRRLEDEGRLLAALDHPVILKVFDLIVLDGRVALVTEFVEGDDLHDAIHGSELPLRSLVETVGLVADALHVAWSTIGPGDRPLRLVHRDIKPQNIRLGIHGQVKLLDFGIAQAAPLVQRSGDELMGSGPYLPPERLAESGPPITSKVDVWGLGCVLYEGLAGERLAEGLSLDDMYALGDDLVAFERFVGQRMDALDAPPRVKMLLAPMLAIDPTDRPSTAEIAEACDELEESMPGTGLLRWARTRAWDSDTAVGPLTSLQLVEGTGPYHREAAPAPIPTPAFDPSASLSDAVTIQPAPLGSSALNRWDTNVTGDEIAVPVPPDIVIDPEVRSLAPLPPVPARRVHPAWLVVGLVGAFALVASTFGVVALISAMPRVDLTLSAEAPDDEGLVPIVAPETSSGSAAPAAPGPPDEGAASLESTGATVELRGDFGEFRAGTPLVVGDYAVWVDFGGGFVDTGLRARAAPGGVVRVSCDRDKGRCFVTPQVSP